LLSEEEPEDREYRFGVGEEALQGTFAGADAMNEQFESIWDAIEDNPAEAEKMKLRSSLMIALRDHIVAEGLTQSQAAKLLGVTQPRISDLMRGKINLFAIEGLVSMVALAGLRIDLAVRKAA
jgi:predicted XRE-type DNA-binding protein